MTAEDLTRVKWVGDPQLSPDGRLVAFVVTTLSAEEDAALSSIWVVETAPDGAGAPARVEGAKRPTREGVSAGPRRFTTGPKRDSAPRWSPDGRWLAFVSERDPDPGLIPAPPGADKGQLYVMPADGGEAQRLTALKGGVKDPVWAPDGRHLACTSRVGGWEEPDDPQKRGKSKPARVITTLKYRLDNEGFVYDRRAHIFVVPFQGDGAGGAPPAPARGQARQVTDGDWDDADPAWAPDSRHLAFVSARHEGRDLDNAADVWLLDLSVEGAAPRCLTATKGPVKQPLFSRDGTQVAYLGHEHPLQSGRNMRLYLTPVTPAGEAGGGRCLTAEFDRTCAPFFGSLRPLWQPSAGGKGAVLVGVESEGDIPIYKVAVDGQSAPAPVISGQRQVTGLSATPDGRSLVFTATDPVSPAEVYLCAADGSGERQLTDLNREWKEGVARSAPQRFRFQRTGATLDVWVMRPPGLAPGQRAPVLLNIHGGPATQYGHTFFDEFQVYAGAGYAVVFANPRGSQGYGEDFSRAITQDWGNEDAADVLAALDEALRRCDFLDPQRLGVLGGSYGGYLTSWLVGHSDRFRAACSERALNDHGTFYGTSDIGPVFGEDYAGGPPWERGEWYAERSPLTYARQITTPLLILHAENDLRCPISQAEQLYVALKRLGREVVLVRFPDEGHEMSRSGRPRHRLERFRIILDWFARYLPPDAEGEGRTT